MPTYCCVPKCSQFGYSDVNGRPVSFFNFPKDPILRKKWIHAIRRDEGKDFTIVKATKVCSLHFRPSDLRKTLNGRLFVKDNVVPSRFEWHQQSPKKRKAPTQRGDPRVKVSCEANMAASTSSTIDDEPSPNAFVDLPSEANKDSSGGINEELERLVSEVKRLEDEVKYLRDALERVTDENNSSKMEILRLEVENQKLQNESKLCIEQNANRFKALQENIILLKSQNDSLEQEKVLISSKIFCLEKFCSSDKDMSFYTSFPNYETFLEVYKYLNPGLQGENIRYCGQSDRGVPDCYYDIQDSGIEEQDLESQTKKGRPKKLSTEAELFMVMCRLRRGFSIHHLSHLFGVADSTVSRTFTAWINFLFLKFGTINIWPSQEVVRETMPEAFKEKFPSTRVIIDCTEIKCEMPSSLLLNSELFSSYKNHTTLKALIGIAPCGAVTFISQLYTGSISDREIVIRSGFLSQKFDDGDSVMADKGFTIQDLLPLGTSLNIPPFLGQEGQMDPHDVIKTQQIASLRIHVERAINRIKNYKIWDGIVPLSQFGLINQMWTVCSFLSNIQDPLISE